MAEVHLICFECASKIETDYRKAIELCGKMREKVLSGRIVQCESCGKYKSLWKNVREDGHTDEVKPVIDTRVFIEKKREGGKKPDLTHLPSRWWMR